MTKKRTDYISWDEFFFGVAKVAAMRSKDPSTQVGSVIVNPDNHILGTGYNGMPRGCSDDVFPWSREGQPLENKYFFVVHSELNCLLNTTQSVKGCRIYVDLMPCHSCAKAIIQAGIVEVIYMSDKYADTESVIASKMMLNAAGVKLRQFVSDRKEIVINLQE